MNKTQALFETLLRPTEASPSVLSKPLEVRTDIQLHVQAVWELINALLNQVEMLQNESKQRDDVPCLNLREEVRRFEIKLIQRALTRTRGSQVQAAKCLGLNATTLNAKLKRYGVRWPYVINSAPLQFNRPNAE